MEENKEIPTETRTVEDIKKSTKYLDPNIRLPVLARVKKRIREIHELSRAKITKIPMGNMHVFETIPPKMFITNLDAKVNGNVGVISYQTYKTEKHPKTGELGKKAFVTQREVAGKMIDIDAHYILDKVIVETIEHLKPLKREELSNE